MKQTNLAKAVAMAITGTVLSVGITSTASASTSTTMYNTYNQFTAPTVTDAGANGTDGWTWSDGGGNGTTPGAAPTTWVGTTDGTRPFGYKGAAHLNWAVELHSAGSSVEVSQANAHANYGVYADIDTAGGAWRDASGTPQGWRHNTDIGLFKSDVTTDVTLKLSAINGPIANFGITLFTGADTNTDGNSYSHHGVWNKPSAGFAFTKSDPFSTTGLTYLTYSANVNGINGLTFTAQANQIYSIYLGGSGGVNWNQQHDGYVLNISSVSAVPVPAAAWLFGSGLLGLLSYGRRKKLAS